MSDVFDFIDEMTIKADSDKTKFDFQEQQVIGDRGEKEFARCYAVLHPKKSDDLAYDFIINGGASVELKTDDYLMTETPNFFIETVSDTATQKPGGPFRAFKDGITFFVYYFVRNKTFFWFETTKLHNRLQELIASGKYPLKSIKNKGWITTGYAIPREELTPVLMHQDYFP